MPTDVSKLEDGLHKGLTYQQYDEIEAVRSSVLSAFDRTPQHAKWRIDNPPATRTLDVGIAVHYLVLQPEEFERNCLKLEKINRRSNAGKAAYAERERMMKEEQKLGIEPEDWDATYRMRDSLFRHPVAKRLLQGPGVNEATFLWHDEETGLRCKGRDDRLIWHYVSPFGDRQTEEPAVIDLKTARTSVLGVFEKDIVTYGYDIQAAHSLRGLDALAPARRKYLWIVVENVMPHVVRVLEFHESGIERAERTWRGRLAMYAHCKQANHWPGWPGWDGSGIDSANLPTWAFREDEGD